MGIFKKKVSQSHSIKIEPIKENRTDYCICELPIKMTRLTSENFKIWRCSRCEKEVDPNSKMINKNINKLNILISGGDNQLTLSQIQSKINEIIDLIKANGMMI